jgi:hypothetical protein
MTSYNNDSNYQPVQYSVISGGATGSINNITPSATPGNPLCSGGSLSQPLFNATPTVSSITVSNTPLNPTDGVNKLYVDNAIAAVNPGTTAYAASTTNIPGTYTPVGSGIGDTFLTTATGAFTVDGTTPPLGSRILFKDQTTTFQNGVYVLTTNGTGLTGTLFTRAIDYDQPSDMNSTGVIAVVNGAANQLSGWLLNVTITSVGSSPITYVQFGILPSSYIQTLTGDSGGALSPTANNFNLKGTANQITMTGSGSTITASTPSTFIAPGSIESTTTMQVLAGNLTVTAGNAVITAGNITLPNTNAGLTQGVITWASGPRIHNFGTDNIFFGATAGNGTLTGTDNIGIGLNSGNALTSGTGNMAVGANCMKLMQSGSSNCCMGISTLRNSTSTSGNTCVGHNSCNALTTGSGGNTCIGYQSLLLLGTGGGNTCIGYQAGSAYTTTESNNICIGEGVLGTIADSGITRIGTGQSACYISGIDGVNVGSVATIVTEASNKLGTATLTAGTGTTVTPTANTITISAKSGGFAWTDVTGGSATLAAQNAYIADKSTLTTFTLPTNNSIGDTILVVGKGTGLWTIVYGSSQNIVFGSSPTTNTTGSLSSTNAGDCVTLVCTTASASAPIFTVISSIGNLTVV